MKINIDLNSESDCCGSSQFNNRKLEKGCTKKCRNRAILYLLIAGTAFLLAFAIGFYIPSSVTRMLWLIISGTIIVLTGISVVVVIQCTNPDSNDTLNSEGYNSKNNGL